MGIAALILGISSLILSWIPFFNWVMFGCGIAGIILGALGKGKNQPCALPGMIISIVAVAVCLIFCIVYCGACVEEANTVVYYY